MKLSFLHRLTQQRRSRQRSGPFCRRGVRRRLAVERLEDRQMLSVIPFGAVPEDTAEYMLGNVSVTLVLMESDGSIDVSTEDWTPGAIESVKAKVVEGLKWWEDALALEGSVHSLNFLLDSTYADSPVPTGYEPIARPWDAYEYWVEDFLDYAGFSTVADLEADIRSFNNAQRVAHDADWAFTIFVASSTNDSNDRFELGHQFTGAFGFAGGLFFVTPSGRSASTITHETGHVFYAKDEYPGGASYFDHRGYYNTQNLNGWDDNPDPDSRVDSIMSSGVELQNAYADHLISPSAKEMIGWKDSDGDGVFDVLDVPHVLEGSGAFDPHTQAYRFLGTASVQTLPNRNESSLGNDISIGQLSRAEYRFDGGDWQTAEVFHAATAQLDLTIPVPAGAGQIEIRTVDDESGITSDVFHAAVGPAESTELPGISGFVWIDVDQDGLREVGEPGLKSWTVTLKQPDGTPLPSPQVIEPDDFSEGTVIDTATAAATLSVETVGGFVSSVGVAVSPVASTGEKVLAYQAGSTWSTLWTPDSRRLKIEFASPISRLRIDVVADSDGDCGRLELFDPSGQLLARDTSGILSAGQFETLELARPTVDVAYALVGGHMGSQVQLDHLRIGVDPTTQTDSLGGFTFTGLDPGSYLAELGLRQGWTNLWPQDGEATVVVGAGEVKGGVDFGVAAISATSLWQNPANALDVDDDGVIAPRDVLWIANTLYFSGSRQLPAPTVPPNAPPPYLDTNGDGYVSPVDALLVVHYWRPSSSGGRPFGGASGYPTDGQAGPASGSPSGDVFGNENYDAIGLEGDGPTTPAAAGWASRPAASAEAPAKSLTASDILEAFWMMHPSDGRREPANPSGPSAADPFAQRGGEASGSDAGPSSYSIEPAGPVLREAGEGWLAASSRSAEARHVRLSTDRLFSDASWLERLLSTSSSLARWAVPWGVGQEMKPDFTSAET